MSDLVRETAEGAQEIKRPQPPHPGLRKPDLVITNDMVYNLAGNSAYKTPPRHGDGNNYLFADGHVKWARTTLGRQWWMQPPP